MNEVKFIDNSDAYLNAIQNTQNIPVTELYDEFIRNNTPYTSLKELLEAGGFKAETKEDIEAIPDSAIDAHIAKNTKFKNWQELVQALLIERLMNN